VLAPGGADDAVYSLAVWEGRLISGHVSGKLRAWDVATGACGREVEGHALSACALAVCGLRLASGSDDCTVKLWAVAPAGGPWACERTLVGHTGCVCSLAGWRGHVLSGSWDRSIRAWDAATGAPRATLQAGHDGEVYALAVHGDRLYSASFDGTIRAWALGTWAALRTVEVHGRGSGQYPWCLAVSGSTLVSGSWASSSQGEVRVWGLEELDLQQTLPQAAGTSVWALAAVEGGVWAGVGMDVVVWGREAEW
jgi:F-box and WD-40 domain protein CDC4